MKIGYIQYSLSTMLFVGTVYADGYPLHTAIRCDNKKQFDLLLQDNAIDINKKLNGTTPLLLAVQLKKEYYIERLVADTRIDVKAEDKGRRNVLEESIKSLRVSFGISSSPYISREDLKHIAILAKSIRLKELVDQRSYETFSLAKSENYYGIQFMINHKNPLEDAQMLDDMVRDMLMISNGYEKLESHASLIDIQRVKPHINLQLMQQGHPLTTKIDENNRYDNENGVLLVDQAVKDNQYYLVAKLLDYGSPLPTSIADKSISSLKDRYLCADEQDLGQKRRAMKTSQFHYMRAQQLGKQAASRYNRMHEKQNTSKISSQI